MIHAALLVLGLIPQAGGFTIDATASRSVEIRLPVDSVRVLVHDLSVVERTMPGVVEILPADAGGYWYRTAREIPFSGTMKTDFHIVRVEDGQGGVTYRTPGTQAKNWMSFRFSPRPLPSGATMLEVRLRVRLVRDQATDVHVLAPLLGEGFLSEHMRRDLEGMLQVFAERISHTNLINMNMMLTHEK